MDDQFRRQARSFGSVAQAYERGRPGFPQAAVRWLVGEQPSTVLELGAGTGKLTAGLVEQHHVVHATDPDEAMLGVLRERMPTVRTSLAGAEDIPSGNESVEVVVAAQAFHWFDPQKALPEIARVLRPGGRLSLVWNTRDERIPWVRRLGRIIGQQDQFADLDRHAEAVLASGLFAEEERATFDHWQIVNRESILDLVGSRSNVATMSDEDRAATLAAVTEFYADYGRGMDGMQLPYRAACFRFTVRDDVRRQPETLVDSADDNGQEPPAPAEANESRAATGPDDDLLLIDFR